jgi:hypothetical protein
MDGSVPVEVDARLDRLYGELESRGARGTIVSFGGVAGGPGASFGLRTSREIRPGQIGGIAELASRLFLDACAAIDLDHGGIARLDVITFRYLELDLERPSETYAGVSELTELFGVSRQRVQELRRKPGFPAPVAELTAGPVWRVSTLQRFLSEWERKPGRPSRRAEG